MSGCAASADPDAFDPTRTSAVTQKKCAESASGPSELLYSSHCDACSWAWGRTHEAARVHHASRRRGGVSSSSNTSHSRFAKISGRINSLYLGASFAPRIEHAASQIHDSSDFPLPFPMPPHPTNGLEPLQLADFPQKFNDSLLLSCHFSQNEPRRWRRGKFVR
jgi:hypothetical protein